MLEDINICVNAKVLMKMIHPQISALAINSSPSTVIATFVGPMLTRTKPEGIRIIQTMNTRTTWFSMLKTRSQRCAERSAIAQPDKWSKAVSKRLACVNDLPSTTVNAIHTSCPHIIWI